MRSPYMIIARMGQHLIDFWTAQSERFLDVLEEIEESRGIFRESCDNVIPVDAWFEVWRFEQTDMFGEGRLVYSGASI